MSSDNDWGYWGGLLVVDDGETNVSVLPSLMDVCKLGTAILAKDVNEYSVHWPSLEDGCKQGMTMVRTEIGSIVLGLTVSFTDQSYYADVEIGTIKADALGKALREMRPFWDSNVDDLEENLDG